MVGTEEEDVRLMHRITKRDEVMKHQMIKLQQHKRVTKFLMCVFFFVCFFVGFEWRFEIQFLKVK